MFGSFAATVRSTCLRWPAVLLGCVLSVLAPFGEGPLELFHRADQLHNGLSIGEVQIRPGAVLQAVLVLFGSLIAVRIFKGWLQNRYLPTTTFDPGMQLSATTLFGYFGVVVSIALAAWVPDFSPSGQYSVAPRSRTSLRVSAAACGS